MSWRKHFQPVHTSNNPSGSYSPFSGRVGNTNPGPAKRNYSSYLPDVYVGTPNRIERYGQYNTMDIDSEVNAALDILAEFCTQKNELNNTPFTLTFKSKASRSETMIISKYLQQWCKLQKFDTRMFRILRNVFKYGDQFFIRDPETKRWFHVDPASLSRIIVNESEGKIPEQYIIRNFNLNFKDMVATTPHQTVGNITNPGGANYQTGGARGMVGQPFQTYNGSRFQLDDQEVAVDAKHIVHLSLSEGLDLNYPFGNSLLESIFKVYKQKELLEDAIIIYRVQRAPERRVFYVDVGNMPTHLAMQFVERVKTEIHQRRIPSSSGGGQNVIDSAYNPLSIQEDYFFPQTCLALDQKIKLLDGRDLSLLNIIEEFDQGKTNWTYTVNQQTHEIEPGKILWAGKTRLNTQLVEVLLDNGEKIKVTPDHRFIMRDGSETEAQYLKLGDSLMSLYLHDANQNILGDINHKHWNDFKESYAPNHKVISVTWMEQTEDTGDITIESVSDGHNFALTAGVFIHNSEGRGSKVETLPGGTNLGEIDDLRYFTNKLVRGLRIPSSYLPTGADDSAAQYNDGRVGTAYIQELRFNTYCERLQGLVCEQFDQEFKRYLLEKGVNIDTAMFDIKFQPPQNFAAYRQSEIDNARVPTYTQMSGIPYISNRFALKRFLGMTDEEIAENERLWREENDETFGQNQPTDAAGEMRAGGISGAGIDADLDNAEGNISAEDAGIDTSLGAAPGAAPASGAQTAPGA